MKPVRIFPAQAERVETGVVQFGDDWPGIFIRGDNAMGYALYLDQENPVGIHVLRNLLMRCDARTLQSAPSVPGKER